MDLQSILAALLNPGGQQNAGQPMGMVQPVGDHALTAPLRLGGMPPQMPQQAPQQQPMPPQAPQGQPMAQPAPQPPQQPQGGGLGGALGGILQNIIAPQSAGRNKTVGWLTSQGLDPGTATVLASDKGALRQFIMSRSQGQKPIEIAGRLVDPTDYHVIADFSEKKDDLPASYKEFQLAKNDGFKGNYTDWQTKSVREQDPTFGREKDLRQEYENNPNVKNYQIVRDNYERIRQGATVGTGAGDLAIVFGYMKMLDPTSVVREGEQASAENTAGVPAAIRNTYNRLMSGDKLSPEARKQLLDAANQVYTQSSQNLGDLNKRYSGIATNYQLDPARVVQVPETYQPLSPLQAQPDGSLPLPPEATPPPGAVGGPAAVTPKGQGALEKMTNPAPIVDWKDYFGKKAR